MGNKNPHSANGLPVSGTTAQLPQNAVTGDTYWDGNLFYVYDDVSGWNSFKPVAAGASSSGQVGIGYTARLRLGDSMNSDGTGLSASASAGKFGISMTAGTSEKLLGEAAQNNTKTDVVLHEMVLPQSYKAGTALSVIVNALKNVAAGTTLTNTIVAAVYKLADAGTMGANLVTTSAAALTASAADYTFAVTGTTLNPGDRILIGLTSVATEGGNTGTTTNQVNSVRVQ